MLIDNDIPRDIKGDKDEGTKMADPLLNFSKLCNVSQIIRVDFSANFIA